MRTQSSFRLLGVFAIIQKETSSLTHVICQKYLHYWLYFYIHVRASTSDGNCKKSLKDFSWNFNCRVEISLVRPVTHLLVPWLRFSVVSWQQSEVQWRRCDCHVGQELRCVLFPRVEVCMNAAGLIPLRSPFRVSFSTYAMPLWSLFLWHLSFMPD